MINNAARELCAKRPWYFLERTKTASTVAQQQAYALPFDYRKLLAVTVTIGTTKYVPREIASREEWDLLNVSTAVYSDTPEYYYIFAGQLNFWPVPSSSTSNAITYSYLKGFKNLSVADYSTGTVDSVSGTAVTGSGTSWASPMAGRFLRIVPGNTASSSGDGLWYEIASVTNSTALVLSLSYNGTALASGAAAPYAIGEMPLLPEEYQALPVYKACEVYFLTRADDGGRAQYFRQLYEEGVAGMSDFYGRKTSNVGIGMAPGIPPNPNNYIYL